MAINARKRYNRRNMLLYLSICKANNKYRKNYDRNKESSFLQYWDANNLYGRAISQKLPANNFEWIKDTSQFMEDFIKIYNGESDKGYFLEVDAQYLEKLHKLCNDLPFFTRKNEN